MAPGVRAVQVGGQCRKGRGRVDAIRACSRLSALLRLLTQGSERLFRRCGFVVRPGVPVRGHDDAGADVVEARLGGDGCLAEVEDAVTRQVEALQLWLEVGHRG